MLIICPELLTLIHSCFTCDACPYFRKIAAIVCSAGAGIQAVLFTDYNIPSGDDPHVFTEIQAAWKDWVRGTSGQSIGTTPSGDPPKANER
jgi:hypothetical protein